MLPPPPPYEELEEGLIPENSEASEAQTTPRDTSFTRSRTIYYDDGNIVLVADGVAFRVHRSHLAWRSEVFRDMFLVANQANNAEVFDGCQVVRLSGPLRDVAWLLLFLYGYTVLDAKKITQQHLGSLLRMSSKYVITSIRAPIIALLAITYPAKLEDWDAVARHHYTIGEIRYVIEAAYEAHADVLLPAAYYVLSSENTEAVLAQRLPSHIMDQFWRGRERLAVVPARFVGQRIVGGSKCDCCKGTWNKILTEVNARLRNPRFITVPHPLRSLRKFKEISDVSQLCAKCSCRFKADVDRERENLWSSLPQTFGLGTWDTLAK